MRVGCRLHIKTHASIVSINLQLIIAKKPLKIQQSSLSLERLLLIAGYY